MYLRVEQVNGRTSFKIREGKTKKERIVYLNNLMADIADYIQTLPNDTEFLFPSRKNQGHITTTQDYRIITVAVEKAGLKTALGTHSMRKTFGYIYYQSTKDIATLMEIFNHSSQKITLRYIGITEKTIEDSIKAIVFY